MKEQSISGKIAAIDRIASRLTSDWAAKEAKRRQVFELRGAPVLPLPKHVLEAISRASVQNLSAPSMGLSALREAIADKLARENHINVDPETDVLVTNGAMHALYVVLTALIEPGDEVLLYSPSFFYYGIIQIVGGVPVYAPVDEQQGFRFDITSLEQKVSARTRIVLVNTPVNPTGYVATREDLQAITDLAVRHDLFIVADESYEKMVYTGEHRSICSPPDAAARGVTVQSFTKSYALPQWRVGYVASSVPGLTRMFHKVLEWMVLTCNYVAQRAALAVLTGPQDWIHRYNLHLARARDILVPGVRALPGVTCVRPAGGPFLFPNVSATGMDCIKFARYLLQEFGVPAVPGTFFQSDHHVRIAFGATEATLHEIAHRFSQQAGHEKG